MDQEMILKLATQIIPVIQKELEVYHYYKKVTFGLLYKIFAQNFYTQCFC